MAKDDDSDMILVDQPPQPHSTPGQVFQCEGLGADLALEICRVSLANCVPDVVEIMEQAKQAAEDHALRIVQEYGSLT